MTTEVEGTLGKVDRYVVQLSVALFFFILVANWFELIPSGSTTTCTCSPRRRLT